MKITCSHDTGLFLSTRALYSLWATALWPDKMLQMVPTKAHTHFCLLPHLSHFKTLQVLTDFFLKKIKHAQISLEALYHTSNPRLPVSPQDIICGHFPQIISCFNYCYFIDLFYKLPCSNIQAKLCLSCRLQISDH